MKKYDEYKDSGVAWIGKVPKHWEYCRFKDFMLLQTTASNSNNKIGLENIESRSGMFVYTGSEFEGNGIAFSNQDIIYGKLRPYLQKVWLATFEGNAVGDFFVFRMKSNSCPSFVKYLMLSDGYTKETDGSTIGAKMPRVSSDFILTMHYCLPPIIEQTAIATYLDTHCAKIDNLISIQQKRIALLQELKQSVITHAVTKGLNPNVEMKPSGVEWIGDVPKHWEVCKLKHYSQVFGRIGFRGYNQTDLVNEGEGAITLSPSNMQNGILNYDKCSYLSWKKYYESPEIMIYNDDVLFVKTGSTYGKISYVADLPMEATINPQIVVFKNIKGNNKYLYYLLSNDIVQMQVSLTVGGSTIPTLSQESILNYIVPLAPKVEQAAIASYLDHKCATIDTSISNAQHQIELLQEYKQSLITEVVTGKRKVTDN